MEYIRCDDHIIICQVETLRLHILFDIKSFERHKWITGPEFPFAMLGKDRRNIRVAVCKISSTADFTEDMACCTPRACTYLKYFYFCGKGGCERFLR